MASTRPGRSRLHGLSRAIHGQGEPGALLLGRVRPGGDALLGAAFYSYAYPEAEGYSERDLEPEAAYYLDGMGEFVLPYEAVRTAEDPDAYLLRSLQSTYDAAADLADWDREMLEGQAKPA